MDWKKLESYLYEQYDKLEKFPSFYSVLDLDDATFHSYAVEDIDKEYGPEVERAVIIFTKTRKWPALSDEAGTLLRKRIWIMTGMVEFLKFSSQSLKLGRPKQKLDRAATIRWLLIDAWNKCGQGLLTDGMDTVPAPDGPKRPTSPVPFSRN